MNYLPFDLEAALRNPERVVTKEGEEVKGFRDRRLFGYKRPHIYEGFINGESFVWMMGEAAEQLRLKPEAVKVSVYVYFNNEAKKYWVSSDIEPRLVARCNTHIDTQTITINKP